VASDVLICEVSPRDGLQNEPVVLGPEVRAELCVRLADAGLRRVEAVSFVHPKLVPAMAEPESVVASLQDGPEDRRWTGLALNQRGFDRAVASGLRRINYTLAVTESFCQRNQGCSRAEAEAVVAPIAERAHSEGIELTVTLAVSFGCPFEGRVDPAETLGLANRMIEAGVDELVLADTIGVAAPLAVRSLTEALVPSEVPIGGHFHDTRNTGIANAVAALEAGAVMLDSAAGGTGGCPFAPGASGNVATEDLVYALEEMGVETGVDIEAVREISFWLVELLGHPLPGSVTRAGPFPVPAA